MSTKLRALYQRRKGRDLFDLWQVLVALNTDDALIVAGLDHYMGDDVFTYPQLAQNLKAKLENPDFLRDIETLVTKIPDDYTPTRRRPCHGAPRRPATQRSRPPGNRRRRLASLSKARRESEIRPGTPGCKLCTTNSALTTLTAELTTGAYA